MTSVALWAPDITPPDEWLIPALLYQERIATFAPVPFLRDADGLQARRLEDLLGDLYEPVHFATRTGADQQADVFLDIVRASLPLWISYVERTLDRKPDPWLRMWASRASGWHARFSRLQETYRGAAHELQQARHALAESEAGHQRLLAETASLRADLASQMTQLEERLRAERLARKELLAPLKVERESLLCGRRNGDPSSEARLRALNAELRAASESLRSASPAARHYEMLRSEHSQLAARLKASAATVTAAKNALAQAARRVDRQRSYLDRPWSGERQQISWLDSRRIDTHRPPGLDTIAFGKVYGPVFEFLATECGLWVAEDPARPYAGTLVGPRHVISDIIEILAECHAAANPGWVLMSKLRAQSPLCASGDDETVSLVLPYVLPAPSPCPAGDSAAQDSYLAAVARFRRDHQGELRILREAIARELPVEPGHPSLDEAAQALQQAIAAPLAEISRALTLNRQLRLKPVGVKVLQHLRHGTIGLALSAAAAAIATPIVGDTIGLQSTAAAVIGGSIIGFTTMTTASAADLYRRRTLTRRIARSPYRYLYDVGTTFDLREKQL